MILLNLYFSLDEKSENYSKDYCMLQIRKEGNEIITEYRSRWNSEYNVIYKQIV